MIRSGFSLVGAAALMVCLPLALSSCIGAGCGCTSTLDPNWTPPALTASQAADAVAKFDAALAGTPPADLVASLMNAGSDNPQFAVIGSTRDGIVDGHSGLVVEWVALGALPNSTAVTSSSQAAEAAAADLLARGNRDTFGLVASTVLESGVATTEYVVTWTRPAAQSPEFSVSINPSTGAPFAFVDNGFGTQPALPAIGRTAAETLALAAVSTPGLVAVSAQFVFGTDHPEWDVDLASADATGSSAPEHGAYVSVDAVSGAASIGKSF